MTGRGRPRAQGCARPPARSGGACPGLGAPGTTEAAEEAPAARPTTPPPRITGRTVWEKPRSTRIVVRAGSGEGWVASSAAQRKSKSAAFRAAPTCGRPGWEARGRAEAGGPGHVPLPVVAEPPPPKAWRRLGDCEAAGKVSRCLPRSAPVPTPRFLGFAAAAGEGLIRFASKDCIYSVLLGEARKHPGKAGRKEESKTDERDTHGRGARPPASHPWPGPAGLGTGPGTRLLASPGRVRVLGGWSLRTECVL